MSCRRKRFMPETKSANKNTRKLRKVYPRGDTAVKQASSSREEPLQTQFGVKNDKSGRSGCGESDLVQNEEGKEEEGTKKQQIRSAERDEGQCSKDFEGSDLLDAETNLVKSVQNLIKWLQELNEIIRKCKQLSDWHMSQREVRESRPSISTRRTRRKVIQLKETDEKANPGFKLARPHYEFCEVVRGPIQIFGDTDGGIHNGSNEVTEIHVPPDESEKESSAKCHSHSHLELPGDLPIIHQDLAYRGKNGEDRPLFDDTHLVQNNMPALHVVISEVGNEKAQDEEQVVEIDPSFENYREGGDDKEDEKEVRPLSDDTHLVQNTLPAPHVLISEFGNEEAQDEEEVVEIDPPFESYREGGDEKEDEKEVRDLDGEMKQSASEQQVETRSVAISSGVIAAEPTTDKPHPVMQKYGPLRTRIRKDGKRWRSRKLGWYHIKKHLLLRRRREALSSNVDTTIQNLLRKGGRRKKEAEFPGDYCPDDNENSNCSNNDAIPDDNENGPNDDENCPYEAYRPAFLTDKKALESNSDEELDDLYLQMTRTFDNGWHLYGEIEHDTSSRGARTNSALSLPHSEKAEKKDTLVAVQKGSCSHVYDFLDDVGYVCHKCGLVGQDIQSIFLIQNPTSLKKRAAVVPVVEQVDQVDSESQDHEGLFIPQTVLSKVRLTLHPFYEEKLHSHQKEGLRFLTQNLIGDELGRVAPGGCILAHAPGTGKSCLTVSFVQSFLNAYPKGRPLIVAPKIMLKPWQEEFRRWNVDEIPTFNLNETGTNGNTKSWKERGGLKLASVVSASPSVKKRLEGNRIKFIKRWLEVRSVLLISYNLFAILVLDGLNDENTGSVKQQMCQALLDGPELLILDEGHFPRTKRTKISQALMRVRTRRKILLSGTLFQNNFKELFNVLKLARHNFMSSSPDFAKRLKTIDQGRPSSDEDNHFAGRTYKELDQIGRECEEQMFMEDIGYKLEAFVEGAENFEEINVVLRKLRALTGPIVHWYTGRILDSLPGLHEFVVYLNLTDHQQKLYSHLTCKSSFEEKTRIAEVCIHPALLKFEENLERTLTAANSAHNAHHDPSGGVKTAFIFQLLRLCQLSGERILIFCQTLSPLALMESMFVKILGWSRGKEILRLDGTMPSDERQSMIEQFNNVSSKACIMLASITACKEGISLVGASRVVILDVPYNPSVVRQAVSRAFRIGQKKRVYVYRLIANDTKEEKVFRAAVQKDWLSRVLMDQSFRMSSGSSFHAENILQVDGVLEDQVLQKMLQNDACKRVNRVLSYHTRFSKN